MKKKKMKTNGSKPSLSSLMSSLYDSIIELLQLTSTLTMDGELSITGFLAIGAGLKSIELQLQAIQERQTKEAITKGSKISSFLNFATPFGIKMTKSEVETLQGRISHLTEVYTNTARRLHPELFSDDTNRFLIQEEANNKISPEAVLLSPSPTEGILQNNQLHNEPDMQEPMRRENKTDNSWFGNRK